MSTARQYRFRMTNQFEDFEYKSLPHIPEEFRRVDWTNIEVHKKSFAEAEEAFSKLTNELRPSFADYPFAYLFFLRAVQERLLMRAITTKQPIEKCLEVLRKRLDLEYGREDIHGKAAQAVILAKYAAGLGEVKLAKMLLTAERRDLEEMVGTCQSLLERINQRLDELETGGTPPHA